jgi:putative endonuclease
MSRHLGVGRLGEDIACEYLAKNSYQILGRNYREKWGEIDVIIRAKDLTLIFVEVKTLRTGAEDAGLVPEDHLNSAKLKKLRRTCEIFANSRSDLVDEKRGWRLDLITITMPPDYDLTKNINDCTICHYKNI